MSSDQRSSSKFLVAAVSSRIGFEDRPATGALVSIIVVWYLFQLVTVLAGVQLATVKWLFTTASFPGFSPGLVLATISHAFPPQVTHVTANVAMLWVFAGESEQHMSYLEVGGFFVVTGIGTSLVGTAMSGGSTLGASGAALAFVGFFATHLVCVHRDQFALDTGGAGFLAPRSLRAYWQQSLLLGPPALLLYFAGQLAGIVPVGQSNVISHLTGLLWGSGYAVVRAHRRS